MGLNSKSYWQLPSEKRRRVVRNNKNSRYNDMQREGEKNGLSEYFVKFIRPNACRVREVKGRNA